MNYRLALTERATADIVNAFKWYESQRNGLGRRFVAALDTAFTLLESMPSKGPAVHGDVRRVVLRQFPYVLYYRLAADRIEVTAWCINAESRSRGKAGDRSRLRPRSGGKFFAGATTA